MPLRSRCDQAARTLVRNFETSAFSRVLSPDSILAADNTCEEADDAGGISQEEVRAEAAALRVRAAESMTSRLEQ